MNKIAVFGASGYLGRNIIRNARVQNIPVVAFVRNKETFQTGEFVDIETYNIGFSRENLLFHKLRDCCAVISTVGITKQKDGLSYDDVDYQINSRILREAEKAGIQKFMYVSVFKGTLFQNVALCAAKERFVRELKASNIQALIIRPTGFYSDMLDFLNMANSGKVNLFGSGAQTINPISGKDLAIEMLKLINRSDTVHTDISLNIGGPQKFSHLQIAKLAFLALKKPASIKRYPDWVRKCAIVIGRLFLPTRTFGPYEFFLTAMGEDMSTDEHGTESLYAFFKTEARQLNNY